MGDIIRIVKVVVLAALAAGSVAACTRNGPPAPVEVKGSQHYGRATSMAATATGGAIVVQRGDTLYALARKHNVPPQTLIAANDLRAPYTLHVGQRLSLPGAPVPATRVVETRPAASEPLPAGSIPPAVPAGRVESTPLAPISSTPVSSAPATSTVAEPARPAPVAMQTSEPARANVAAHAAEPQAPTQIAPTGSLSEHVAAVEPASVTLPARAGRGFQWPVRGRVVSDFGPKGGGLHNDGINIAASRGTPIRAAESGVVVYAGNELRGFGNLVLLRHADGWMTAYGHADELTVQRGDQVRRGQVIGRVGATGNVTSPQIHFEIRRGSRPVNPRDHLVSESASAE
ncbi:MAG TPA: M23 family metallopeptidase [Alphaproteobacteria bacterium]|nr:M23 family metallopeptidase [Alphaproteobacteria bacterium]